jgi:DNA-binding XRE family transcriptional regulator
MDAAHPHSFGALLKRYREAAGLTQEELAERAALSPRGLIYLERRARQPYPDTVRRLATALSPRDRAAFEAAARGGDDRVAPPLPSFSSSHPAVVVPPLVGRGRELALLALHLTPVGAAAVSPPVLVLAGEPGIGKSRLLHEAAQCGASRGWRVLEGGCQRRGGQEPYAPLLGALKRYIGGRVAAQLRVAL